MRKKSLIGTVALLGLFLCIPQALPASQQTFYFDPGQGNITYTVTPTSGQCGRYRQFAWNEWSFTNLAYVDNNGHSTGLGGGGGYYWSNGTIYDGCPPTGPQPSQIVYGVDSTGFIITWHPGQGQGTTSIEFPGNVIPNYEVVGLFYAPPGHQSYADYSQTTMVGASTSMNSSFQSTVIKTVSFGYSGGGDLWDGVVVEYRGKHPLAGSGLLVLD